MIFVLSMTAFTTVHVKLQIISVRYSEAEE